MGFLHNFDAKLHSVISWNAPKISISGALFQYRVVDTQSNADTFSFPIPFTYSIIQPHLLELLVVVTVFQHQTAAYGPCIYRKRRNIGDRARNKNRQNF